MLSFLKKNTSSKSDLEIISLYKKKEEASYLTVLLERYSSLLYGICLKYLKNEAHAEDAVMEIVEKLMTKLKSHEVKNFKSWLSVLVKNHCLEILRKQGKHLTVSLDQGLMQNEPYLHPFEEQEKEQSFKLLENCIETLQVLQKECVNLFYYQNKTYKEIAALKDLPLSKIRSYIQNGRRNLKICMEKMQQTL